MNPRLAGETASETNRCKEDSTSSKIENTKNTRHLPKLKITFSSFQRMPEAPVEVREDQQNGENWHQRGQDFGSQESLHRVQRPVRQSQQAFVAGAAPVLREEGRLLSTLPASSHSSPGKRRILMIHSCYSSY